MKKVLTVITCSILAACSCDDSRWEQVDSVTFDDVVYEEQVDSVTFDEVVYEEKAPVISEETVIVEPAPVYVQAPQIVADCPCAEVAPAPCYQQACKPACGCASAVAPKPKVTKTKKIITTTTTMEEPCGKEVCEPVVTVHEEIITDDGSSDTSSASVVVENAPVAQPIVQNEYIEVTVDKNPYSAEVVDMRAKPANVSIGTTAKYSPEAYIVVATRATNRMLQDTAALYEEGTKRIYIKDIKLLSSDLPYGSHRLKGATKDIINGSKTFDVVNNINNADFVIEPSAEWYVAQNNATPAIQYKLSIKDKNGKKVDEWIEIIRQVKE
ncbi:MAG: hypothetical protein IKW39_02730 [Alphaproteobacteria bacterium]|nr:hypothetical protein [Alphaproteobacteria bacterium]